MTHILVKSDFDPCSETLVGLVGAHTVDANRSGLVRRIPAPCAQIADSRHAYW
jgi:hypothetical protein